MKFWGFGKATVGEVEQEVEEVGEEVEKIEKTLQGMSVDLNREFSLEFLKNSKKKEERTRYAEFMIKFRQAKDDIIEAWSNSNKAGKERLRRAYVKLTGFIARTKDKILIKEMKKIGEDKLKIRYA